MKVGTEFVHLGGMGMGPVWIEWGWGEVCGNGYVQNSSAVQS